MEQKTKFNVKKCKECKYHGTIGSRTADDGSICCERYIFKGTSLKKTPKGGTLDVRGDDYDNCKCYEKGKQLTHRESPKVV